jgi:hypothetical protein
MEALTGHHKSEVAGAIIELNTTSDTGAKEAR